MGIFASSSSDRSICWVTSRLSNRFMTIPRRGPAGTLEGCLNDLPDTTRRALLRDMEQLAGVAGRKYGSARAETQ